MLLVHLISPWSICRVSPVGFEVKLLDYSSGSSGPQSMWHPKPLRLFGFMSLLNLMKFPMKSSLTPHEIPIQAHQLPTSSLPTPSRIPGPVWLGYLWRAATRRWGPLPRFTWRGDRCSAQVEDIEKITRDMTLHYIKDTTSKGCPDKLQMYEFPHRWMRDACFFGPGHLFFLDLNDIFAHIPLETGASCAL